MTFDINAYGALRKRCALRLLRMHYESGVGHIGGNLSCLDAMLVLHHHVMGPEDVFVLSKGHSAGMLYITLWSTGCIDEAELASFHAEGTRLAGHPAPGCMRQIPVATGSLGHGFPTACGMAKARKLQGKGGRVFCLMSDGEWQEGSNWEALGFAVHHKLDNLTVLVDCNGLQGFGSVEDISSIKMRPETFIAHGADCIKADGHDASAIIKASDAKPGALRMALLRTVKGKGVFFMQNEMKWHYLPMDKALYEAAVREVESA